MAMIIDFRAKTRKSLITDAAIEQIQEVICSLRDDFLEDFVLFEEDDNGHPHGEAHDFSQKGTLPRYVKAEMARSEKSSEQWRLLMKDQLPEKMPFERRLGSVHFVTRDGMKNVHFFFDEYRLAPVLDEFHFGNTLSLEWQQDVLLADELSEASSSVATRLFDNDLFEYGFCYVSDQYDAKNIDRSGGGVKAVGLDASKCLPGFYWGNYFGGFLCDLIGEEVLMSVPGCHSRRLSSGILVTNELPPDSWSDPAFIENENHAMDHIGRQLFFEKGKPVTGTLFT